MAKRRKTAKPTVHLFDDDDISDSLWLPDAESSDEDDQRDVKRTNGYRDSGRGHQHQQGRRVT